MGIGDSDLEVDGLVAIQDRHRFFMDELAIPQRKCCEVLGAGRGARTLLDIYRLRN